MKKWIVGLMTICLLCLFSGCTGPQTETAREKESRKVTIENTDTQGTPEVESDKDSASDTSAPYPGDPSGSETEKEEEKTEMGLHLKLGTHDVTVEWEDNESVRALAELAAGGLSVSMSRYGGFEQVGPLGKSLPRNDTRLTTSPGDIVLYSGNQIVIFYGSNEWSYTRLGKIKGLTEDNLREILGQNDIMITLTTGESTK